MFVNCREVQIFVDFIIGLLIHKNTTFCLHCVRVIRLGREDISPQNCLGFPNRKNLKSRNYRYTNIHVL